MLDVRLVTQQGFDGPGLLGIEQVAFWVEFAFEPETGLGQGQVAKALAHDGEVRQACVDICHIAAEEVDGR